MKEIKDSNRRSTDGKDALTENGTGIKRGEMREDIKGSWKKEGKGIEKAKGKRHHHQAKEMRKLQGRGKRKRRIS